MGYMLTKYYVTQKHDSTAEISGCYIPALENHVHLSLYKMFCCFLSLFLSELQSLFQFHHQWVWDRPEIKDNLEGLQYKIFQIFSFLS